MTARQFGAYAARIISPMAHIDGPHGVSMQCNAGWLREILNTHAMPLEKRKAMTWALLKLEGEQP